MVAPANESYDRITENAFHQSLTDPLSTFSIDVDTASYSKVIEIARLAKGNDKNAYRQEFIDLVRKVEGLKMPHQARLEE